MFLFIKKLVLNFSLINIYIKKSFFIIISWYFLNYILRLNYTNLLLNNIYIYFNTTFFFTKILDKLFFSLSIGLFFLFIFLELKKIYKKRGLKINLIFLPDMISLILGKNKMIKFLNISFILLLNLYVSLNVIFFNTNYDLAFINFKSVEIFFIIYIYFFMVNFFAVSSKDLIRTYEYSYSLKPVVLTKKDDLPNIFFVIETAIGLLKKGADVITKGLAEVSLNKSSNSLCKEILERQRLDSLKSKNLILQEALRQEQESLRQERLKSSYFNAGIVMSTLFLGGATLHTNIKNNEIAIAALQKSVENNEIAREQFELAKEQFEYNKRFNQDEKEFSLLSEENLKKHNSEDIILTKDVSKGSLRSRKSIKKALDLDLNRVIFENNGVPIKGNCTSYDFKKYSR